VLSWFRNRRQVDEVHRLASRPFQLLESYQSQAFPGLWQSPYCCTVAYFWTAVVAENLSPKGQDNDTKFRTLREAFARLVEDTQGEPHDAMRSVLPEGHPIRRRAMIDLKRVVDLYNGHIEDRHMIYPEYREAVYEDGRPAPAGNKWGLDRELAYEILLSRYLAANALIQKHEEVVS
jgi:hypothetical protein